MATQELGQSIPAETKPAGNSGVLFSLAYWYDRKMRSYIRPAEVYDPVKAAIRKRNIFRGISALEAVAVVGLAVITQGPKVSDILREDGVLDATTPVRVGYRDPNFSLEANPQGERIVRLKNPYDIALAQNSAVSGITPGVELAVNLDAMDRVTTDPKYGVNIPAGKRVASIHTSSVSPDTFGDEIQRLESSLKNSPSVEESGTTYTFVEIDKEIQKLLIMGYVTDRKSIASFPLPIFGGGGGTLKQHLSTALSTEWLKQILILANENPSQRQKFDPQNPPSFLLNAVSADPVIEALVISREKYDARQKKGNKKFSTTNPVSAPVPNPSFVPNTSTRNSSAEDSEIRCRISFVRPPATRMPAIVDFEVGLASFSPISADKKIGGVQIDYEADGEWDTDLSPKVSTYQTHVYSNYGINRIAARVELTNGQVTKPCFNEFNLR